jgi:hypothetical protein
MSDADQTRTGSMCATCPFSCTEEAEAPINWGCVPCGYEIMELKRRYDRNWGCHSRPDRLCAGYVMAAREEGLDYRAGKFLSYEEWYRGDGIHN